MTVTILPTGITPADVLAVARGTAKVVLDPATVEAMSTSRSIVDGIEAAGRPVYGVSTASARWRTPSSRPSGGPSCSTR